MTVIRIVEMSNVLIILQNKMWQLAFGKYLNTAVTDLVTHQFSQFTCCSSTFCRAWKNGIFDIQNH